MPVNDAVDDSKPDARAFKIGAFVKALKYAEQFVFYTPYKDQLSKFRSYFIFKLANYKGVIPS